MTHNLKKAITLDELNELYTLNKNKLTLYIEVQGQTYEYNTLIKYFLKYNFFNYIFLDTNGEKFLEILIKDSVATSVIELVNKKVKCIGSLTPLETVFYLRTWFCAMIGIKDIFITDAARSACKDDFPDVKHHNKYKNDYSLQLYRMLATQLPLESISIYTKFFKNKNVPVLNQEDRTHLEALRRMTMGQFKTMTRLMLDEIKDLPQDNKRKKYDMFYEKMKPIISLPTIYDELTLFTFFDRFLQKQNCQDYSTLLNSINEVLINIEPYRTLLEKTARYTVHVTDSIYYNNLDPKSNYSGKRRTNKRTKNKSRKRGRK